MAAAAPLVLRRELDWEVVAAAVVACALVDADGRVLAEGNVHQIRDLIDEHPHTVFVRAGDPRAIRCGGSRLPPDRQALLRRHGAQLELDPANLLSPDHECA